MIAVSEACREVMAQRRDFRCFAQVTLADGRTLSLDGEDFTLSGNGLTDGAGTAGLPLGAAVCRQIRLCLANDDERWNGCDFFGARIRLWLTLALEEPETAERIELGTFTVAEPASLGGTVSLTAWDDMCRADRPYETALTFPATLGSMFREICERCAIPYGTAAFPNEAYSVPAPPAGELTCRQVLGHIAMLAGGNARVDRTGNMQILPYRLADEPVLELDGWSRLEAGTDDITVTGLSMTVEDTDEDGEPAERTALWGEEEGYVLQVENPLVQPGQEEQALALMGAGLIGQPFRPFRGEHAAMPLGEFMDAVMVRDRRGRTYRSVLTDVDFAVGGYTALSNSAEPAAHNESRYVSPETQARQTARSLVERERTARQAAVERLSGLLAQSGGLFTTTETTEEGGTVYYLHNKPALADSVTVMKLTADAIGFSTDGGRTWPYGFAVTGEMVMGIIRAEGLSADWVRFGTLPQERVDGLADMSASLAVMRESITAAVQAAEELQPRLDELGTSLTEQMELVREQTASLDQRADGITGMVSDVQKSLDAAGGEIKKLQGAASELRQTAEALALRFETVEVDHVTTATGYTFNADGLDIAKAGEEMHNQLTNLGMYVRRNDDVILKADAGGVEATDVRINNFLLMGRHARFEDYTDGTDSKRTACFFV